MRPQPDLSNYEPVTPQPKKSFPIPTPISTRSPFMRSILPYPFSSQFEVLQQFYQNNLPQFRFLQK